MKNKILFSIVIAALLISGSLYVRYRANAPQVPDVQKQNLDMNDSGTKALFDDSIVEVYKDPVYHFRINYPSYLSTSVYEDSNHYSVNFRREPDPWQVAVIVSTTTTLSARKWVEEFNQTPNQESPDIKTGYRIEHEVTISGIPTVVVHSYSDWPGGHEEFTYEKSVLLVKDGKLFTISARTTDPQKIWNSFKFEK